MMAIRHMLRLSSAFGESPLALLLSKFGPGEACNMRTIFRIALASVLALGLHAEARAEPTGSPVKIKSIRSYNAAGGAGMAFIQVSSASPCNTDTYKIDLSWGGSREVLATALSAFNGNHDVAIEIANSTGCTGWGTLVQSIYILKV